MSSISDTLITDAFWINDVSILFRKDRLTEYFPSKEMSKIEKLNAIGRLSILSSIILILYKGQTWPLYIGILGLLFSFLLYRFSDKVTDIQTVIANTDLSQIGDIVYGTECTAPTKNNPFMNISVNEYLDNPTRAGACDQMDVKEETETYFNKNLYKDINDLFNKNNSQRMFHTNPITTIPNDQGNFANWLYSVPSTCKEDQSSCLRYEDVRANSKPVADFDNNPVNLLEDKRVR